LAHASPGNVGEHSFWLSSSRILSSLLPAIFQTSFLN
jgi:hypothetical protein